MSDTPELKPSPPPGLPLRAALVLGAVVTLAHLWLLGGLNTQPALRPFASSAAPAPAAQSVRIRRIEPDAPAPTVASARAATPAAPARALAQVPAPSPAPPPSAAATAVEASPEPVVQPAPSLPDPLPAAPVPAPAEVAASPPPAQDPVPPSAAFPVQLPGSARLTYALSGQARGFNYSAEAQLLWQHDGRNYQAALTVGGFFLLSPRSSSSVGEIGPLGVEPRRFSDRMRSEQATHFQPEQGRIVFSSNAPQAPWQAGVQDRLSLFFQLAGLLGGDPARFVTGAQVQVPTAGTREADLWTFTVMGRPTLDLPVGEQATIALRREPRRPYDQTIEIWFAPALGHLPVRIRIVQGNGDVLDQKLSAVQPL